MFQTFSVDFDDDMVMVTCPSCGNSWMIDTLIFCAAVRDQTSLICPDCDSYLTFELSCLTRVAEQRNGAEAGDSGTDTAKENESR